MSQEEYLKRLLNDAFMTAHDLGWKDLAAKIGIIMNEVTTQKEQTPADKPGLQG